jgi:hypothetical protein
MNHDDDEIPAYEEMFKSILLFSLTGSGIKLRKYQEKVALAIVDSVVNQRGMTFVVIFPRQSGKNELQAQLETYLLTLYHFKDAEMVKVSPTWKPQSLNAMRRLQRVLRGNVLVEGAEKYWAREQGYIFRVENARIYFLSGAPTSNVVGATASTLLECDEAQDVLISKWDKEIAPMAASTNATRVFWGTAWTSKTLLAREKRAALEAQKNDGRQRVFIMTAEDVTQEVPAYGKFVAGEIAKHGRNHPFVKTQYFSEEIDAEGGMFPPGRRALMQGDHERQLKPQPGTVYALLIDVAGEDEGIAGADGDNEALANAGRDATAMTLVEVDLSSLEDELVNAPTYRVVNRRLWVGTKHTTLYGQIVAQIELFDPRFVVIDATGVGAGLASFFESKYPEKLIPFVFSQASKSRLGWNFLSVIESGRFKDHRREQPAGAIQKDEQAIFWQEVEECQMEVIPGPERKLRWGVPDGTRAMDGELVHDDLLISAALVALLDEQTWGRAESEVIEAVDPLAGMDEVY